MIAHMFVLSLFFGSISIANQHLELQPLLPRASKLYSNEEMQPLLSSNSEPITLQLMKLPNNEGMALSGEEMDLSKDNDIEEIQPSSGHEEIQLLSSEEEMQPLSSVEKIQSLLSSHEEIQINSSLNDQCIERFEPKKIVSDASQFIGTQWECMARCRARASCDVFSWPRATPPASRGVCLMSNTRSPTIGPNALYDVIFVCPSNVKRVYGKIPLVNRPMVRVSQAGIGDGHRIGVPERAIDGRRSSLWRDHSCTHTKSENKAWWRVDFDALYTVSKAIVVSRRDCCRERLNGFKIIAGNTWAGTQKTCQSNIQISQGQTKTIHLPNCINTVSSFVIIQLPKTSVLTLCELELYGQYIGGFDSPMIDPTSSARFYQTTTQSGYPAWKAMDGNIDSFSHTTTVTNGYWAVNFGNDKMYQFTHVRVTPRRNCCQGRISGFDLYAGVITTDSTGLITSIGNQRILRSRCAQNVIIGRESKYVSCYKKGNWIFLFVTRRTILNIGEVEVYGKPV